MSLKNKIYNLLPPQVRAAAFKRYRMDDPCGYGEVYRVTLQNAFDTFLTEEERKDAKLLNKLTDDIVLCWVKYMALPYEYFLFNFRHLSDAQRCEFETDIDRISTLSRVSDVQMFEKEINDKYNFYCLTKSYFKREAINVGQDTPNEIFVDFAERNENLFVKPLKASQGVGARTYSYTNKEDAMDFLQRLKNEGNSWMVEERIVQSNEMAQWNPTSVNTIRIPTFLRDGKFTVIWTRMRMGKKGAIVDNAGAGGIVVNVDPQTGVVTTDGIDEAYNHFEQHPDAGLTFKGWQVPCWQELLQVVEELHRTVFPKHIYIAWDFALTDAGWVVIEGNWGQLLGQQTASQVGEKRRFHELLGA